MLLSIRMLTAAILAATMAGQVAHAEPIKIEATAAPASGVLRIQSKNSFEDTVARLKADVTAKGIRFFDEIDQSDLGAKAELPIGRSTLVIFGNPPLGVQFLQSNPYSGLDWPVRMLVLQDKEGKVWVAWTDFAELAARYRITDKDQQFDMASEVARSIATAAASAP